MTQSDTSLKYSVCIQVNGVAVVMPRCACAQRSIRYFVRLFVCLFVCSSHIRSAGGIQAKVDASKCVFLDWDLQICRIGLCSRVMTIFAHLDGPGRRR